MVLLVPSLLVLLLTLPHPTTTSQLGTNVWIDHNATQPSVGLVDAVWRAWSVVGYQLPRTPRPALPSPVPPRSIRVTSAARRRPNSIIFGDGRRPRGAIGDYGGRARHRPALFCRTGAAPSRSLVRPASCHGRRCSNATCARYTPTDRQTDRHAALRSLHHVYVCEPCVCRPAVWLKHSSSVVVVAVAWPLTQFDRTSMPTPSIAPCNDTELGMSSQRPPTPLATSYTCVEGLPFSFYRNKFSTEC